MTQNNNINNYKFDFRKAAERLSGVAQHTPLMYNANLSKKYQCNVYFKREDLQTGRSYKLRGAYNMISSLTEDQKKNGVVCASAGNHAQGFAHSCKTLGIKGVVFMPAITPQQKIKQTKMFGEDNVEVILTGDTYDECSFAAKEYCQNNDMKFIPPFDNESIIEGQGTVGLEILEDFDNSKGEIDYLFLPVGGGGLCSGVSTVFRNESPNTKIIALEPKGAPAMAESLKAGEAITLDNIDPFVDGAAVKKVGDITFEICKDQIDEMHLVPEGKICTTILNLYNEDAIVVEPAGALSVAALDDFADQIKGKNIVCVISGGNNDIARMQEIKERSLRFEGLKHYFLVRFPQRAGALKEFVNEVLGPDDDITRFEYMQKNNKETGPALIGVLLKNTEDYDKLTANMTKFNIDFTELNKNDILFGYLV